MYTMRFDVTCVRECLMNNGRVFTVRTWDGSGVETMVNVPGVGQCKKVRIMKVSKKEDIARYIGLSGFDNLDAWWKVINSFGAGNGWLFLVAKVI